MINFAFIYLSTFFQVNLDLNNQPAINTILVVVSMFFSFYIIPPLTGWLTAKSAEGYVKSLVATFLSLLEAVIAVLLAGQFNLSNFTATALAIIVTAGVSYKTVMGEPSVKLQETGPQIGAKTNG